LANCPAANVLDQRSIRVKDAMRAFWKSRGVENTKCGDSQSRQKSIYGESSGNSIGVVSKFSSLSCREGPAA
jgi:hypothetical protein